MNETGTTLKPLRLGARLVEHPKAPRRSRRKMKWKQQTGRVVKDNGKPKLEDHTFIEPCSADPNQAKHADVWQLPKR